MKIIEIKLEKKISGTINGLKNEYDNELVSAVAMVEEGEHVEKAMANLRSFVESSLGISESKSTMVTEKTEVSEPKEDEKPASKKKASPKKATSKKKTAAKPKAKKAVAYDNTDDNHKVIYSELADKHFTEKWRAKGSDLRKQIAGVSKELVGEAMFSGDAEECTVETILESFEAKFLELAPEPDDL